MPQSNKRPDNGATERVQATVTWAQAAEALACANAAGIVHRDMKPGNVLVDGGQVKITDFGIARAVDAVPITRTGLVIGTPAYLSPERVAGWAATPLSDLYGLGVIAYECLTGRPPPGQALIGDALAVAEWARRVLASPQVAQARAGPFITGVSLIPAGPGGGVTRSLRRRLLHSSAAAVLLLLAVWAGWTAQHRFGDPSAAVSVIARAGAPGSGLVSVVVAALVIDVMEVMRRRRLQQRFGPEYDRVAGERDGKLKAESEPTERVRRVRGP